jgi:beta-glucanase (GH16 family)
MGLWALDAASSGPNEIDTIESGYGSGSTPTNQIVATTVHPANNALLYNAGVDISAAYHIYGWEYLPGQWVKFYFDGVLYDTVAVSVDYPYELIMNLQMASSSDLGWHPPVDSSTPSPSVVLISGVEVWQ